MRQSFAKLGCLVVLFAASCAQSAAIDEWDAPGAGLGGSADDGETAEPRADASMRDARGPGRADAEAEAPDEGPDEPDTVAPVDASVEDARSVPVDTGAQRPDEPRDAGVRDAGPAASEPEDAGALPTGDAGPSQCAACPPPGDSCMTPIGTCGCRLLSFGPCGPRPPFAP